jgi:hypothetical protein
VLEARASIGILVTASKSPRCFASVLGGHGTSAAHQSAHPCANQSAMAIAINSQSSCVRTRND